MGKETDTQLTFFEFPDQPQDEQLTFFDRSTKFFEPLRMGKVNPQKVLTRVGQVFDIPPDRVLMPRSGLGGERHALARGISVFFLRQLSGLTVGEIAVASGISRMQWVGIKYARAELLLQDDSNYRDLVYNIGIELDPNLDLSGYKVPDQDPDPEPLTSEILLNLLSREFGIAPARILGPSRDPGVVLARQTYHYLLDRFMSSTQNVSGRVSNRERSVISHSVSVTQERLRGDKEFVGKVDTIIGKIATRYKEN